MLSPTLRTGLDAYAIGDRLRALRLKKKIGLVELGKHTRLSPGLLSKLERGRIFPTLPTLLRISLVFGVGLEYFFAGPRDQPVAAIVRRRERVRLPDRPKGQDPMYWFESLDFRATERKFNAYQAEFLPVASDKLRPHEHPGVEFIVVLEGVLGLRLGQEDLVLEAQDSIYFDSTEPHAYRRLRGRRCKAVVITAV
jgi:transcriptional regulator with XRE-family HTH domain